MLVRHKPEVENWYRDNENDTFAVIAVDEDAGTVEVQYFEGEIEELDMDTWYQFEPQPIAPPEDWTGPFDSLVRDDLGDTEVPLVPEDWNGPADEMDLED